MSDQYLTILQPAEGIYRERGSKFIARAYSVSSEEEVKEYLEEVKKLHPKARHHCYAYRIGTDGHRFRANDDGEPSNSAGRPILGQIDSFGLTNTLVVVTRYFGGTKLGVSGLINAYKTSAAEALAVAGQEERTVEAVYTLDFDYAVMGDLMNALKRADIRMVSQDFGEQAALQIAMPQSEVEQSLLRFKAVFLNISHNEAASPELPKSVKIKFKHIR